MTHQYGVLLKTYLLSICLCGVLFDPSVWRIITDLPPIYLSLWRPLWPISMAYYYRLTSYLFVSVASSLTHQYGVLLKTYLLSICLCGVLYDPSVWRIIKDLPPIYLSLVASSMTHQYGVLLQTYLLSICLCGVLFDPSVWRIIKDLPPIYLSLWRPLWPISMAHY